MANVIDIVDNIVREEIAYLKRVSEPEVDGIFSRMYNTSKGVTASGIGLAPRPGKPSAGTGGLSP